MDEILSFEAASKAIDLAALGLLALALFGSIVRRLDTAILLLALQGVMLGVASGAAALAEMQWRSWAAFIVAIGVKAIIIPLALLFVLSRLSITHDLETTIAQTDCDAVVIGTPIDLRRVIRIDQPSTRVFYDLQEIGVPTLNEVLDGFMEKKQLGRMEAVRL